MKQTLIEGFRDVREREQSPKPNRRCLDGPDMGIPLYECRSSKWEPYQSLRLGCTCDGGGEADERFAWRCSCGMEVDCDLDRCSRCGSDEPGEPR